MLVDGNDLLGIQKTACQLRAYPNLLQAMFYHIVSERKHRKSAVFCAVKIYLPENENGNILL